MKVCKRIKQQGKVTFYWRVGRQCGLVVTNLDTQTKGCGFDSGFIQNTRWKWGKSMQGLIPAPNSGSFENKKIQVARWSTLKTVFLKRLFRVLL